MIRRGRETVVYSITLAKTQLKRLVCVRSRNFGPDQATLASRLKSAIEPLLRAAGVPFLNRWALGIAVGAVHATIAFEWLEQFATAFTFIEELTRIRRHQFWLRVPTCWAGDF